MKRTQLDITVFARSYGLLLAWVVTLLSTAGALITQYIFGYEPCMLCWYQRICMFPLVVILGVAAYREDRSATTYALPLAIAGTAFALFHYLEQKFPSIAALVPCRVGIPCSTQDVNWLGFITFPLVSFVAFAVIVGLLLAVRSRTANS